LVLSSKSSSGRHRLRPARPEQLAPVGPVTGVQQLAPACPFPGRPRPRCAASCPGRPCPQRAAARPGRPRLRPAHPDRLCPDLADLAAVDAVFGQFCQI
jgi:hypothetical protein